MKIPEIPFNTFIGLINAGEDGDKLLRLEFGQKYHNHLGTLHASALFALAEASSGEFLFREFGDSELNVIPVVRKATIRYSKPVTGDVYSRAGFAETSRSVIESELRNRKRSLFTVSVEIMDSSDRRVAAADIEWFVALKEE